MYRVAPSWQVVLNRYVPVLGGQTYPDTRAEYAVTEVPKVPVVRDSVPSRRSWTGLDTNGAGRGLPIVNAVSA
jgi:hypothetical protein